MRPLISTHIQEVNKFLHQPLRETSRQAPMVFRPMTVDSADIIRPFMNYNRWRTCDYTMGGMLMWTEYFDYHYCIIEDTLFIKGISENHPDIEAFSLPLGRLPYERSIAMLSDYCYSIGVKPAFTAVPKDIAPLVAEIARGVVEPLDGWSDYLYSASALATLEGKQYSKKRNHVNRFMVDNPDYRFEMLSARNIDDAREFLKSVDLSSKVDLATASYELNQCLDVLNHIDKYQFEGGVLYDETGSVCAVCLGEAVADTLYVHIEKMNHLVSGAGETINKLFAETMTNRYAGLKYINREEDMGDEGLRYAKNSYHPVALLEKCNIVCQ